MWRALVARVPPSRTIVVSRSLFAEIATLPADIGVLAVVATPRTALPPPARFCLLLEDVQDPGNVGAMIRTAAAAGVEQVLLSRHCAFAWSPKVLRAGQGAHFLTTLVEDVDLAAWIAAFRAAGGRVVATVVAGATPLHVADLRGRLAIAIGSEGSGLSESLLALRRSAHYDPDGRRQRIAECRRRRGRRAVRKRPPADSKLAVCMRQSSDVGARCSSTGR